MSPTCPNRSYCERRSGSPRIVGFVDLFEPFVGLGIVFAHVGVILPGEAAVGLLDLLLGSTAGNAEDRVVVFRHVGSRPAVRRCVRCRRARR